MTTKNHKDYTVTIVVRRYEGEDHPGRWDWHDLIGGVQRVLDVTEVPEPTGSSECPNCGSGNVFDHPNPADGHECHDCGFDWPPAPPADDEGRCEHGMFTTGAGACPACGG